MTIPVKTAAGAREDAGRILDSSDDGVSARYKLNDIYCAAWLSHAVSAIVEHRVPDFLPADEGATLDGGHDTAASATGDGGRDTAHSAVHYTELAARTNLHAPSLYRVLRALAANGIFTVDQDGRFAHNAVSRLLRTDHPQSWSGMSRMWDHPSCLNAWLHHRQSLRDGKSGIEHAFGKPLYAHLSDYPDVTKAFSDAMISNSAHAADSIAREFPFADYNSVVDLGGGVGTLLLQILQQHRHLQGILFEIPELEDLARQNITAHNLDSRCQFVRGDWFSSVPQGADLYLVKNSLWNWNDEQCLAIMCNVRQAMRTSSGTTSSGALTSSGAAPAFVIIEYVIDDLNKRWTTLYDLQILNMPGGRARTADEYRQLLEQSGFKLQSMQYIEDQTVVIGVPD